MIGVAQRRPTHDTYAISRTGRRNGASVRNTATERATNMSTAATSTACPATDTRLDGKTSSPISTNIEICISHAMASWKRSRLRCT